MRKMIFMLLLAVAVFASGCGNEEVNTSQEVKTTEEVNTSQEVKTTEEVNTSKEVKTTEAENESSEHLEAYMMSLKEQSDSIKASLENDELTQYDMNQKSEELYTLWDDALNYLWGELKNKLPEEEFAKLLDEQRSWITEKEKKVEEAGKEVEGGSLYPLIVNSEAASITEERVYELYEQLK